MQAIGRATLSLKATLLSASILVLPQGPAWSENNADRVFHLAMSSYGAELTKCAAYFGLTAQALRTRPEAEFKRGADDFDALASKLLEWARMIARKNGQQDALVKAQLGLSFDEMLDAIKGDYNQIAILRSKHGATCESVAENKDRLNYWVDEAAHQLGVKRSK